MLSVASSLASLAALAEAPYLRAEKPITDDQGRVQVIIDFADDAHLAYSATLPDFPRNKNEKESTQLAFFHNPKTEALVDNFEKRYGFTRTGMTSWVGNSVTGMITRDQLAKIAADPLVKQISDDEEHRFSAAAPPWNNTINSEWISWGADAVNAKISIGNTGRKIYIIDSGVAFHDDLPPMIRKNVSCGGSTGNCNESDPYNYPLVGCYAHATHVAGIIGAKGNNSKTTYGVYAGFPNMVSLNVSVRTTADDCSTRDPSTLSSYISYALDYISWDNTNNNPNKIIHVVTMSINSGGATYANPAAPGPNWAKVHSTATGVWMYGLQIVPGALFVQSSGNWPSVNSTDACLVAYSPGYQQPASDSDGLMVVGAVNSQGRAVSASEPFSPPGLGGLATYEQSTFGACVDSWAPGENIVSTWGAHSGPTVSTHEYSGNVGAPGSTEGWAFLSGTSMAAPHVAAVAAWLADVYGVSTAGALESLVRNASTQHNGAIDGANFPVKIPRLP